MKKVEASLLATVRTRGHVDVMIALIEPAPAPAANQAARRAEIARMQSEVLKQLSPQDYRSRLVFQDIPAMAGTVLSERALHLLNSHTLVARVDPDAPGTGSVRN